MSGKVEIVRAPSQLIEVDHGPEVEVEVIPPNVVEVEQVDGSLYELQVQPRQLDVIDSPTLEIFRAPSQVIESSATAQPVALTFLR